jgi:hypothetical protein
MEKLKVLLNGGEKRGRISYEGSGRNRNIGEGIQKK